MSWFDCRLVRKAFCNDGRKQQDLANRKCCRQRSLKNLSSEFVLRDTRSAYLLEGGAVQ